VKVWVEEGRSFVSRSDSQYDLIMIHGIDTFAALSSGAYVLSESYLYTVEAMKAYLNHLSPGGTLCIVRWDYRGETARLFTVALEALYELGVENPEQNIFYGTQAHTCLLVRKDGFSDGEIDVLQDYLLAGQGSTLFPPLDPESAGGTEKIIAEYTVARSQDKHQAFLDAYRYDISPVRDDSPFFFHYEKTAFWRKVGGDRSSNFIRGNWSSYTLHMLFGFSCVAVVLFMVLPLLHRGRPNIPHFPIWLLYFACLGVSFIFVEIALMQRFALLLGHPARSLALVLTSLLFFAGVGSQLKHTLNLKLSTSLAMIVVMLLVVAWGYPPLVNLLLGFSYPVRVLATILMVAPTAFFMGMPFPAGITRVAESGEDAVPWMWGINGGTTVVGSILAILVAIEINFTIVLLLAALGYAIALLMNWKVLRIS
jgi:hypothetical protein